MTFVMTCSIPAQSWGKAVERFLGTGGPLARGCRPSRFPTARG